MFEMTSSIPNDDHDEAEDNNELDRIISPIIIQTYLSTLQDTRG